MVHVLPATQNFKKEEMTEERKASWASKLKPGPLLSSKSGSATDHKRFAVRQTCQTNYLTTITCIATESLYNNNINSILNL